MGVAQLALVKMFLPYATKTEGRLQSHLGMHLGKKICFLKSHEVLKLIPVCSVTASPVIMKDLFIGMLET